MSETALQVITPTALEKELTISQSNETQALREQADNLVQRILEIDARDLVAQQRQANAVVNLGQSTEIELTRRSAMLKAPMSTLVNDAQDGGKVAKDLIELQEQVAKINPNKVDFSAGGLRKALSWIPGIGTPLSRWFSQYQTVDAVIQDIVKNLKEGGKSLENDNVTLVEDQRKMRELGFALTDYVTLGKLLDERLTGALTAGVDDEKKRFVEEEVLFPLRQRIIDLQQRLAVCQQGILAVEVIVRNNRELVKGVKRATEVTVMALNTAATLQVALQHQKRVLEGVQAVTETTNDLLVGTSEQLKTQGVAIQKQASEAQLDIAKLKTAFENTAAALDEISSFRRDALPQMAQSIVEMDALSSQMEQAIGRMEEGNALSSEYQIELVTQKEA